MKALIAIVSCTEWERNEFNDAIRQTWAKDAEGVDVRFFQGRGDDVLKADAVRLDARDGRDGFSEKTKEIHRWAVEHGFDFVFQCTGDTFVNYRLLMDSGFENHDYFGHVHTWPGGHALCPWGFLGGGEGYWASARLCRLISEAVIDDVAEDRWVGNVAGRNAIKMVDHPGYGLTVTRQGSLEMGGTFKYEPAWMYDTYKCSFGGTL